MEVSSGHLWLTYVHLFVKDTRSGFFDRTDMSSTFNKLHINKKNKKKSEENMIVNFDFFLKKGEEKMIIIYNKKKR